MKNFGRYFFGFTSLIILVVFYFLKTNAGQQKIGNWIEDYLSKETYSQIKVRSLNLEKYPYLVLELQVNNTANITVQGRISNNSMEMHYHLSGDTLKFNDFQINDNIDIQGSLSGSFSSLAVTGYGNAFEGEVSFNFLKIPTKIKEMTIHLKHVNSKKVLDFLEQEPLLAGLADIDVYFQTFSRHEKQGQTKIYMEKAFLSQLETITPFVLNSTIDFQNIESTYKGEMHSDMGMVTVNNGYYHKSKKTAHAQYTIHLKNLAYFENILKQKYQGVLDINGSLDYDNGLTIIKGHTAQFGGNLSYVYKEGYIDFKLKAVSLENLLKHFSFPIFFSSKLYGTINFNIKDKIVIINTDLKETHFIRSELTDTLYQNLEIDMLAQRYDQSHFSGGYHNSIFSSTLKIDNGKSHIYLTDSVINILKNSIDSKFEINMQGQEICGDIYGTLQAPKVKIDKRKFMKYQTNKQVGSWLGTTD